MKKLLITTIVFFFITLSFSQTWAPVGAKWYYSHYAGSFEELTIIESIGDTTINSKQCKILNTYQIHESMDSTGSYHWDTLFCPLQYSFQESGIVYLYDFSKEVFDMLYNFNAVIGDTITVKDTAFQGYCPEAMPGNLFEYVIDSITDTLISSIPLQKQFISPTQNSDWIFSDPWQYTDFPIYEWIGSSKFLFGIYHLQVMEGSIYCLRCYQDSILSYRASFWPDTVPCGQLRPLHNSGIESINNKNLIDIYPNPANSTLFIEFDNIINSVYTIEIYSLIGTLQLKQTSTEKTLSIDIRELSKGIYFIRIHKKDESFIIKLIKE